MTDWITARTPTERDADKTGFVIVCITPKLCNQWNYELWHDVTLGWPWRHASTWTPPTPTPEATPAAPKFRGGQLWRTRGGRACTIIEIEAKTGFFIKTDLYGWHSHDSHGKSVLSDGAEHEDDLVELISENPPQPEPVVITPTPAAPEPEPEAKPGGWITQPPTLEDADCNGNIEYSYLCVLSGIKNEYINWRLLTPGLVWRHTSLWKPPTPAAPKPKPEKEKERATRGFLAFTRVKYEHGLIDSAVGTDNTAWVRFFGRGAEEGGDWLEVTPLPQPGEE